MIKAVAMETENHTDEETGSERNGTDQEKGLQSLITIFRKDIHKELVFNLHDSPDDQKPKKYYVDCIEILLKECTASGGINIIIMYLFWGTLFT